MSQQNSINTLVQPNVLCTSCKSYWERASCLALTVEELRRRGDGVPSLPQHLLHSHDRSEIVTNASSGCHFCSIIVGSVLGCTGNHEDRTFFATESPIYIATDILSQDDGTFLLTLFPCEQAFINSHDLILNTYPLRLAPSIGDAETTTTEELQSSSLQTHTFSENTAKFIKSWISQCKNDHALCGTEYIDLLQGPIQHVRPRRMLDLMAFEDQERFRLIDADKMQEKEYCALSYSWGFSKPFVMTSSNLEGFQQEIWVKDLPRTIADAVHAARGIGFRYLWIDALCIMQDGGSSSIASEEWCDQVNKLHDIFGNAIVTIAASESFDGEQGFIHTRNPLSQLTCQLYPGTKLRYEVVPPCTPHCLAHPFDSARYHLDTRAWVFQERILSLRTIHFSRNFIHLECRTELVCETSPTVGNCHHSGAVSKADYQNLFSVLGMFALDESFSAFFLNTWHEILRKYSATNLSRTGDLLVAIAGLVTRIQKQSQLTWSFGLWREYLLQEMLWYVRGGKGTPCRERAPSWSWASIELRGPHILYEPSTSFRYVAKITGLPAASVFAMQPALTETESVYSIKISGPLRICSPNFAKTTPDAKLIYRHCQGIRHIHRACPFHPDYELSEDVELYCLLIARDFEPPQDGSTAQKYGVEFGVVLTPVAGIQTRYRRIGYFHHTSYPYPRMDDADQHRRPPLFDDASDIREVEIV